MKITVLTIMKQHSVMHDPSMSEEEANSWLARWAKKIIKDENADGAYAKTFSFGNDDDDYSGLADFEWKPDA